MELSTIDKLSKLTLNRIIILLSGLIAFISVCFSLSSSTAKTPHFFGFSIYFLFGLIFYKVRKRITLTGLAFLPFIIPIIISLTNNNGLFPIVVPILIITCIVGFYVGSSVQSLRRDKLSVAFLIAIIPLYLYPVTQIVIPRVIFSRLNEPLPSIDSSNSIDLKLINQFGDTVVINTTEISVLDFWHTRCGVCYPNNDFLNNLSKKYQNLGIKYYLIYMGIDPFEKYQSTLKNNNWKNLIQLYDSQSTISSQFKLQGAPHTLIISNNKIIYHQAGFSLESSSIEERTINKLLMHEVENNADLKTIILGESKAINLDNNVSSDSMVHTYRFKNASSNPIYIQDIRSSCNCMVTNWTQEEIIPNDFGLLSFKIFPNGKKEDTETIVIGTNSSVDPYTIVNFSYKSIKPTE